MKRISVFSLVKLTALLMLLIAALSTCVFAGDSSSGNEQQINPPVFDFADFFYQENGINLSVLNSEESGRFGRFRQTGPPGAAGEVNWVIDNSNTDIVSPVHNNVRILATTAAYRDDTGLPDVFFTIIAFARSDKFFGNIEPPAGSVPGTPTDPDNLVSGTPENARGIRMQQILGAPDRTNLPGCNQGAPFNPDPTTGCQSAFEAYGALTQRVNGVLAPSPCGSMGDGLQPCFPVTSVETPHLRQDWRVSSNRNRIDNSASFSYFSDNLLGMWVITYFWYTPFAVGGRPGQMPTVNCQMVMAAAARQNGVSLDGTPIVRSGNELNFLEGQPGIPPQFGLTAADQPPLSAPCAAEGNEDPDGTDGGAVWLVCPTIPDPTQGGIAQDAFLDTVRRPNGTPVDPRFTETFKCLRDTGQFCSASQAAGAGLAANTIPIKPKLNP